MQRKSKSKKECQVIHAKRRAFERYGLELNHARYRDMVIEFQKMTQAGYLTKEYLYDGGKHKNPTLVRKISNRMTIHDFPYNDNVYRIVYDKMRKVIVTFLPMNDDSEITETQILQEEENDN